MIEVFDNSIKTPSQFSKVIKLDLKGVLNKIDLKRNPVNELILNEADESRNDENILFKNNVRKLRHEIDKTGKQVFLITSTQENTGKTLVTQSLAFSFLLSNKKVLLIDLNFQNNMITKIFNCDHFVEDIFSEAPLEPEYQKTMMAASAGYDDQYLLEDVVLKTEIIPYNFEPKSISTSYDNLFVIGCRGGNHSPSEVISIRSINKLVNAAKRTFDYILIESSSLNNRSDSYELFQFAERVVTVFSASMTPTQSDFKSIESLKSLEEKNFGAVINQVEFDNINL
jgi:Mrp family chromosome partitioning ATPase